MIYLGNFSTWIKQEYIDFMLSNDGTPRPSGGRNPNSEEFKKAQDHGYDLTKTYWYIYESDTFPFEIKSPIITEDEIIWWGIKMNPGNFMPIHRDPHTYDPANFMVKRFWMALQDWEPGHIFMYEDQVLVNYKKGDIYSYPNPQAIHCACNIGNSPRLTFHFSTYQPI